MHRPDVTGRLPDALQKRKAGNIITLCTKVRPGIRAGQPEAPEGWALWPDVCGIL